jgi:hypothetical protein
MARTPLRRLLTTTQYLLAGNAWFSVAVSALFVGSWYLSSGYFVESLIGRWNLWLEYVFVATPALMILAAVAVHRSRRKTFMASMAALPLRTEDEWPAWVWISWFQRVARRDAGLRTQYLWMAAQLRGVDADRELSSEVVTRLIARRRFAVAVPVAQTSIAVLLVALPGTIAEPLSSLLDPPLERVRPYLESIQVCDASGATCVAVEARQLPGRSISVEWPRAEYNGRLRLSFDTGPRTRRRVTASVTDPTSAVSTGSAVYGPYVRSTVYGRRAEVFYRLGETRFATTLEINLETSASRVLERVAVTLILRDPKSAATGG